MSRVLLAGRFDPSDPSSGARLQAFAGALEGVTVGTTAPGSLAEPLGFTSLHDSRRSLFRAIKQCDVVVIAGGNAFDSASGTGGTPPARHTAELVTLARACRRPVALVGVGAERIEGRVTRALARFVVRSADLLVLRDEPSAAALDRAGATLPVRVAADPVWCVLRYSGATGTLDELVVVVVDEATASPYLLDELSPALAMVPANGVCVQPWRSRDVPSAASLADMLPGPIRVLPPVRTLDAAMQAFGTVDVVVSMCAHATMAAAAAGTPTVALGRSRSLAAVTRRLGHDLVDRPIGARPLADVVERARRSRSSLVAVRHEQALADGSMALLRLLVDRGEVLELAAIDGLSLSDGRRAR
jgi:polysaccharide pyruvyl transferase WcaK-like protein